VTDQEIVTLLERLCEEVKVQHDAIPPWFERWQREVYGRDEAGKQTARSIAAEVLRGQHTEEGVADTERWRANEQAHKNILDRLDSLNGWRNKVYGVLAFVGVAAPLGIAAWAIVTRG